MLVVRNIFITINTIYCNSDYSKIPSDFFFSRIYNPSYIFTQKRLKIFVWSEYNSWQSECLLCVI